MSQPLAYVDTSALMKRFITEDRTAEMEAFARDNEYRLAISSLDNTFVSTKNFVSLVSFNTSKASALEFKIGKPRFFASFFHSSE